LIRTAPPTDRPTLPAPPSLPLAGRFRTGAGGSGAATKIEMVSSDGASGSTHASKEAARAALKLSDAAVGG
jgi:hypothetical protein